MGNPGIVRVVWAAGTANGQENAMSEGNRWNRKSLLRTATSPFSPSGRTRLLRDIESDFAASCKPWIGRDRVQRVRLRACD